MVSWSPFSFPSKTPCTLRRHSFKGCGPGALPPLVTSRAPFGRISEKSNHNIEPPVKYTFIKAFIESDQPSIESPIR